MAVRTIECSACGTTVPYGRLSCPACGELLASVAGAPRRLTSLSAVGERVDSTTMTPAISAIPAGTEALDVGPVAWPDAPPMPSWSVAEGSLPAVLRDVDDAPVPVADDEPAVDPVAWPPSLGTGSTPTPPTSAAPAESTPPMPTPRVGPAWLTPDAPGVPTPGMYLPPTPPAVEVRTPIMAGPPAPARAWAGTSAAAGAGARSSTAADQMRLSDPLHGAEAIGWVGVAGAAIAAVGFLLPWSSSVIGADGVGYFDRWGFAGPGHLFVVAAILAVLALAFVKNPIPAWARLGIPGLILGSLLVGLVWPYVFGLSGAQIGAPISLIGGLVLITAATACLAIDRHASSDSAV